MLRLRYFRQTEQPTLDFGEFVSDHERMMFLGTASFAPFFRCLRAPASTAP